MDSNFASSTSNHERIVAAWMQDCIRAGGIERSDEIHIDRIDEVWREPALWISGSLEILSLAISIRDLAGYRGLLVAVAFSLQSRGQRSGVDFTSLEELEKIFSPTPPSLYMFRRGNEPWTASRMGSALAKKLDCGLFGLTSTASECIYLEFKESEEYYRSIFLSG
jgi:hypothetical protein